MTLYDYISKCGGQVEAAHRIGVTPATLSRWVNGHCVPMRITAMRLSRLGIGSLGNRETAAKPGPANAA